MPAYHPVGEPVVRNSSGKLVMPVAATYVQTYSTALRTVPAATVAAVSASITTACPAGGTGAAAGGWDTAGHRDTSITTATENRLLALSLKTQINALRADLAALYADTNSLIDDLQDMGIVG